MDHNLPSVSIIIVNFNGEEHIENCLHTVANLEYPNFETIVVDNLSSDESTMLIEENFQWVKLIKSKINLGFAGGNNLGVMHASGEILAFLNPDTIVDKFWLEALVAPMLEDTVVGFSTSKILLLQKPDYINTCGNLLHFTGIPSCRGWNMPADKFSEMDEVASFSGASFAIRKTLFEKLNGFDESFFMYVEDTDLSIRGQLAGYQCRYTPESIVYHNYNASFSAQKIYYLERNRYQFLIKNFYGQTLFVLLPCLLLTELVVWGYLILNGKNFIVGKIKAYLWLVKEWEMIKRKRQLIQKNRILRDADILGKCNSELIFELAYEGKLIKVVKTVLDPLFNLLFRYVLFLVRW